MDAEASFRILAALMGAGATIGGFLMVAAIFLMGQFLEHARSYSWLKEQEGGLRMYVGLWAFNLVFIIGVIIVPFFLALGIVFEGVDIMTEIPGGNAPVDDQTASRIENLVESFKTFVLVTAIVVSSGIVIAYGLPQISEYYLSILGGLGVLVACRSEILLSDAFVFLKERPAIEPPDGDILRWARNEFQKGSTSEFRRFVDERLPDKMKIVMRNRDTLLNWTAFIILLALPILWIVLFVIWNYFF